MDNKDLYLDFIKNFGGKENLACDGKLTSYGALLLTITAIKLSGEFIDGVCKLLGVEKIK